MKLKSDFETVDAQLLVVLRNKFLFCTKNSNKDSGTIPFQLKSSIISIKFFIKILNILSKILI